MVLQRRNNLATGLVFIAASACGLVYTSYQGQMNHSAAVKSCQHSSSDLPRYDTLENRQLVHKVMQDQSLATAWLPLKRKHLGTWVWLDGQNVDKSFYDGNWKPHMNCGFLHLRDGVLEVDNCTYITYGVVCKYKDGMSCSEPGCVNTRNSSYVRICSGSNWYRSQFECEKEGMGMAIVRSDELKSQMKEEWYADNGKCNIVWVGLRREDWQSPGDSLAGEVNKPYWGPGQPSQKGDCAVILRDGDKFLWKTAACNESHGVICVRSPVSTTDAQEASVPGITDGKVWTTTVGPPPGSNAGLVAGLVVAVLLIIIAVAIIFFLWKRRSYLQAQNGGKSEQMDHLMEANHDACAQDLMRAVDMPGYGVVLTSLEQYMNMKPNFTSYYNEVINVNSIEYQVPDGETVLAPVIQFSCEQTFTQHVQLSVPHRLHQDHLQQYIKVYHRPVQAGDWTPVPKDTRQYDVYFMLEPRCVDIYTKHCSEFLVTFPSDKLPFDMTTFVVAEYNTVTDASDRAEHITQDVQIFVYVVRTVHLSESLCKSFAPSDSRTVCLEDGQIDLPPVDDGLCDDDTLKLEFKMDFNKWTPFGDKSKTMTIGALREDFRTDLAVEVADRAVQRESAADSREQKLDCTVQFTVECQRGDETVKETSHHSMTVNLEQEDETKGTFEEKTEEKKGEAKEEKKEETKDKQKKDDEKDSEEKKVMNEDNSSDAESFKSLSIIPEAPENITEETPRS